VHAVLRQLDRNRRPDASTSASNYRHLATPPFHHVFYFFFIIEIQVFIRFNSVHLYGSRPAEHKLKNKQHK